MTIDSKILKRNDISKFFGDSRSIKAVEGLFTVSQEYLSTQKTTFETTEPTIITSGSAFIVVTSDTNITLQSVSPANYTEVTINIFSGVATIDSPLGINGFDEPIVLYRPKTSVDFIYIEFFNTWVIK